MHRSGTSAFSYALPLMGVALGDQLIAPAEFNPKGLGEDGRILAINEALLKKMQSHYDDLIMEQARISEQELGILHDQAVAYVRQNLERYAGIWGFKDPRTCRLLPFWQKVFHEVGCQVRYVLVLRNPLSVMMSLASREYMPKIKSVHLWMQHMLYALRDTQGECMAVVRYDDFMENTYAQLQQVAQCLNFPLCAEQSDTYIQYRHQFLEEKLQHNRYTMDDFLRDPDVPEIARKLQIMLQNLSGEHIATGVDKALVQEGLLFLERLHPWLFYNHVIERQRMELMMAYFMKDAHEQLLPMQLNPPVPIPVRTLAFYSGHYMLPTPIALQPEALLQACDNPWSLVQRALPVYTGHVQPKYPADMGYYQGSNPQILARQFACAKNYGISGFIFYDFDWKGHHLAVSWLDLLRAQPDPQFRAALMWINQPFSGAEDGPHRCATNLVSERLNLADLDAYVHRHCELWLDNRYIRVNDQPLLLIYRADLFDNMSEVRQRLQELAKNYGVADFYCVGTNASNLPGMEAHFDAVLDFEPDFSQVPSVKPKFDTINRFTGDIQDYTHLMPLSIDAAEPWYRRFRSVFPAWDSTPLENTKARIVVQESVQHWTRWVLAAAQSVARHSKYHCDEKILFLRSWNEWQSGSQLEADSRFGYRSLEGLYQGLVLANRAIVDQTGAIALLVYLCDAATNAQMVETIVGLKFQVPCYLLLLHHNLDPLLEGKLKSCSPQNFGIYSLDQPIHPWIAFSEMVLLLEAMAFKRLVFVHNYQQVVIDKIQHYPMLTGAGQPGEILLHQAAQLLSYMQSELATQKDALVVPTQAVFPLKMDVANGQILSQYLAPLLTTNQVNLLAVPLVLFALNMRTLVEFKRMFKLDFAWIRQNDRIEVLKNLLDSTLLYAAERNQQLVIDTQGHCYTTNGVVCGLDIRLPFCRISAPPERPLVHVVIQQSDFVINALGWLDLINISGFTLNFLNVSDPLAVQQWEKSLVHEAAPWLCLLQDRDVLDPYSYEYINDYFSKLQDDIVVVYTDEVACWGQRQQRIYKTGFSLVMMRQQDLIGRAFFVRTSALTQLGGLNAQVRPQQAFDLLLRIYEAYGDSVFRHWPQPVFRLDKTRLSPDAMDRKSFIQVKDQVLLAHLTRTCPQANLERSEDSEVYRVHYPQPAGGVSVVVVVQDQRERLRQFLANLIEHTLGTALEIILLRPKDTNLEMAQWLDALDKSGAQMHHPIRVLDGAENSSWSELMNQGTEAAQYPFVLWTDIALTITQTDWLAQLLGLMAEKGVAAVGPRIWVQPLSRWLYGWIPAESALKYPVLLENGQVLSAYPAQGRITTTVSMLEPGCFLLKKAVWQAVGGLEMLKAEPLAVVLDFCCKVQQAGLQLLWHPDVAVTLQRNMYTIFPYIAAQLRQRWPDLLAHDPHYHPALSQVQSSAWKPVQH